MNAHSLLVGALADAAINLAKREARSHEVQAVDAAETPQQTENVIPTNGRTI
jgi:hypothetical protein